MSNIQLQNQISPADLLTNLKKNIDNCSKATKFYLDKLVEQPEKYETEIKEIKRLHSFLEGPLRNRLMGVYQDEGPLKSRYLNVLEPFYSEEGIRTFVELHFDVIYDPGGEIVGYRKKDLFEKEVGILFVLYKVKKTIETIITLQKNVGTEDTFPSSFSQEEQKEHLETLKEILKLFFIKFIKKEYLKSIYQKLSENQLSPAQLLKRKENNISYVQEEVLVKNVARELFILLFFNVEMRIKANKKDNNIQFNYLDFELIKSEFLTDWMQRKLKGNKNKDKIFDKYKINGKTITELVKENPEKEGEILQKIPLDTFNDIAEQINEVVDEQDKTPVSTFSKNHGEIARSESIFNRAQKIAKLPLAKMQNVISNLFKSKKAKKKVSLPKSNYALEVVDDHNIDFVYFDENHQTYQNKLTFLKKKLGDKKYATFHNDLWQFFQQIDTYHLIKREEPVKEWAIPFLLKNENNSRLLIIGAEISQKKTQSGVTCSDYQFNPYFVFGINQQDEEFGKFLGSRKAKGTDFYCYSYAEEKVQKEAISLFDLIIAQSQGSVFKMSNLKFKAKKDQVKTEDLIKADDAAGLL